MAKEYIAKESTSQAILTKATETDTAVDGIVGKVGETNDSSGSTTSGGIFAKLNKVITDTTSLLTRLTTARAASLDRIGSNGDSGNDTLFGVLSQGTNIEPDVKEFLNSTVGTDSFQSLDKLMFKYTVGTIEFDAAGTYNLFPPEGIKKMKILACGAGGGASRLGGGGSGGEVSNNAEFEVSGIGDCIEIKIGKGGAGGTSNDDPVSGEATTISKNGEEILNLSGGNIGGSSTGGASVGYGSGKGGNGKANGSNGLYGKGGKAGTGASSNGGGGGGSIGPGGNGGGLSGSKIENGSNGVRGGGGGAGAYNYGNAASKGGNGGDGYCKITWLLD